MPYGLNVNSKQVVTDPGSWYVIL